MNKEKLPDLRLLVVDDEPQQLQLISDAMSQEGLEVASAADAENALVLFTRLRPQIVLLDLFLAGTSGMEVLERILAVDPGANVILMTGHYSTESAVEAIRKGALDCLDKPLDLQYLRSRIAQLLDEAKTRRRTLQLDEELVKVFQFEGLIGRSPLMLEVFSAIRRIAPHFRTALIMGETGTGKELVARALHKLTPAASSRFAVCNCAALVETLLESELFGHTRGAFTGATQDKTGLFEYANGGTVFLDEIGEMPLSAQAKLLRVLQQQEVQRVGSPIVRKIDIRVVAATHRDLSRLVAEGRFREDLYYRISMVEITVPPLSERKEDLPLLQRHFIEKFAAQYQKPVRGITRRAQAVLARYHWPGNVRELENVIGRACMLTEGEIVDIDVLPERLQQRASRESDEEMLSFEELQRRHLVRVLERVNGNKILAARILGISRTTLYKLLAQLEQGEVRAKAASQA